jgi:predicted CoA-binding protein
MTPGQTLRWPDDIEALLRRPLVVAVVGCHVEASRPAHSVPAWLHRHGHTILPVNPRFVGAEAFGRPFVARLDDLNGHVDHVDVVNVFRRSEDIAGHEEEFLALCPRPGVVWLQSGIRHSDVMARLRAVGIHTVEDRCLLADGAALGL